MLEHCLIVNLTVATLPMYWLHHLTHDCLQLPHFNISEHFIIIIVESSLSFFTSLPQIGRQFERVHMTSAVTHHQDWLLSVECNMIEHSLLLGDYCLRKAKLFYVMTMKIYLT